MNKVLHGAVMGFILGAFSVLLLYIMWVSIIQNINNTAAQHWTMALWVIGYTGMGAILGAVLPKHK